VLSHDKERKIIEIGAPVGVIVALTPSTNPTSTAIFKSLISVKARNAVIVAPPPPGDRQAQGPPPCDRHPARGDHRHLR